MKKVTAVAMAGLLSSSACNVSWAQSTVTLYGLVDLGFNYLSSAQTGQAGGHPVGHSQYSMQEGGSGGISGSRWGLKGNEDLGGGLSAIFQVENGFSANTGALGQGGDMFGRQAWVGLKSERFGAVTLGRQYDSVVTYAQPFGAAAQWAGYISAHPGDVDNMENTRRINNSIRYASPSYRGLTFGGLYSLGGVPGSTGRNQVFSLGAAYTNGPLSVGAAYLNARNPNLSFYGTNGNAGTTVTSNNVGSVGSATTAQSNPVYGGYASARTLQIAAVGGAYTIGAATLGATYSYSRFGGLGDIGTSGPNPFGYSGNASFNNAEFNFKYQVTPAFLAGIAYDFTHGSGASGREGATYHQGSVGVDYFLSKRTDLYTILVYQHASGTDSLNQPAVASITGQTASASNHQVAVRLGMRVRF
ncbi:porin [Burkholderia arboris]|uniref:porin n=1 Tax=Burkholderia arboris TaxID=488730 RepID=UPI001CF25487|nr:porin [Burkholderia arboris]MCA8052358.1 porin [Burkholderia arboris]